MRNSRLFRLGLLLALIGLGALVIANLIWFVSVILESPETFSLIDGGDSSELHANLPAVTAIGVAFAIYTVGLGMIAASKRRSVAWGIASYMHFFGLLVVLLLRDESERVQGS